MTREQADARLRELGMVLDEMQTSDGALHMVLRDDPKRHTARSLTPYVVAVGATWREAFGQATGEVPF